MTRSPLLPRLHWLLLAGPLSLASAAQVPLHVVDPGGGGDFTELQAAVDAAAPGDVLVLRPGEYGLSDAITEPLVLVGEPGASLFGPLEVRDLAAPATFVARGLDVRAGSGPILRVEDATGVVLFEDCTFDHPFGSVFGLDGAELAAADAVHLSRCTLVGGSLLDAGADGVGLTVRSGARAHLYGTEVVGGPGDTSKAGDTAAVVLGGSELFASGSTFHGGDGGDGAFFSCEGGAGGAALVVESKGGASTARLLATTLAGGTGGTPFAGCAPVVHGPGAVVEPGSQLVDLAGAARASELDATVVEGGTLSARLSGAPGDLAFLFWSTGAAPSPFVTAWNGPGFLALPLASIPAGTLPAGGETTLAIPVPSLGLGVLALPVLGHGVFVSAAGELFLGSPTATVIVGAAALP